MTDFSSGEGTSTSEEGEKEGLFYKKQEWNQVYLQETINSSHQKSKNKTNSHNKNMLTSLFPRILTLISECRERQVLIPRLKFKLYLKHFSQIQTPRCLFYMFYQNSDFIFKTQTFPQLKKMYF